MPGIYLTSPFPPAHPQHHPPTLECSFLSLPQPKYQGSFQPSPPSVRFSLIFPIHLLSSLLHCGVEWIYFVYQSLGTWLNITLLLTGVGSGCWDLKLWHVKRKPENWIFSTVQRKRMSYFLSVIFKYLRAFTQWIRLILCSPQGG